VETIMRVAIGGVLHESNSFSPLPTRLEDFVVQRGDDIVAWWQRAHHEVGGFIEGADKYGYDLVPLLVASATPGGKVMVDTFETLVGELTERLAAVRVDGLLLALHGAMVCEAYPDGDGDIVRRLRELAGPELPIVVTNDLHANVSEQLIAHCDALVVYKTYPHIDQRERGLQAASIIARTIKGEISPVQAMFKPLMLLNIVRQNTNAEPIKSVMAAVRDAENKPNVLSASLAEGYQYADVYEMGPSVVVVTDGDRTLAETEARRLSDLLWNQRDNLSFDLPDASEAVRQAQASDRTPVILVDMGDNIGGGSAGDSTFILSELLRQQVVGWLVVLADPLAAQACTSAGIGSTVTLDAGGKRDNLHGSPVSITGRVKSLHDGRYIETEPRHGGQRYRDQGITAVLELPAAVRENSSYVILTSRREPPFSLNQLKSLGIQPEQQRIIVVKAAVAFRAAYEPIAGTIIEVDTGGLTAVNPMHFTFRHVRQGLWGLK
jgi:microcystin degradation protein MlrC